MKKLIVLYLLSWFALEYAKSQNNFEGIVIYEQNTFKIDSGFLKFKLRINEISTNPELEDSIIAGMKREITTYYVKNGNYLVKRSTKGNSDTYLLSNDTMYMHFLGTDSLRTKVLFSLSKPIFTITKDNGKKRINEYWCTEYETFSFVNKKKNYFKLYFENEGKLKFIYPFSSLQRLGTLVKMEIYTDERYTDLISVTILKEVKNEKLDSMIFDISKYKQEVSKEIYKRD
jgi:hypothetical protein